MRAPGVSTDITTAPKAVLKYASTGRWVSGIIDDAERYMPSSANPKWLPAGMIVGRNSNSGLWFICWGAELSADEAAGQTTLSVTTATGNTRFTASDPDAAAFNIKIVGPGGFPAEQDLGAITGVAANTITITNALVVGYPSGSYVYRSPATDYNQDVAVGILDTEVSLDDGYGGSRFVQVPILVGGIVDTTQLAYSLDLWLSQLRDGTVGDIVHGFGFES